MGTCVKAKMEIINVKNDSQEMDKYLCMLCKHKKCLVDHFNNKVYCGRITRSVARWLNCLNNFKIIEVYRSMPLLGDEEDITNWDVHLVRYSITL